MTFKFCFNILAGVFSEMSFNSKLIKQLYFTYEPSFLVKDFKTIASKNKYSLYMKYTLLRLKTYSKDMLCCCRSRKSYMQSLTKESNDRLMKDMDFIALVDTIYKLKATLSVLVKQQDSKMLKQIKKEYIDMKKIHLSSSEDELQTENNTYKKFMTEDMLFELQYPLQVKSLKRSVFQALKPVTGNRNPHDMPYESLDSCINSSGF